MNFLKIKQHKYSFLIILLALMFLGIHPQSANAVNPTLTQLATNNCTSCNSSRSNAFNNHLSFFQNPVNPSTIIGKGLIISMYCNPGTTFDYGNGVQPSLIVNSIIDNASDPWTQVLAQPAGISNPLQLATYPGQTNPFINFIWFTNVVSTTLTSMSIYINWSPYGNACVGFLYQSSTGLSVSTFFSQPTSAYAGTGIQQANTLNVGLGNSQPMSIQSNTFTFETTWLTLKGTESIGCCSNSPSLTTLESLTNFFSAVDVAEFYTFNSGSFSQSYNVRWSIVNTVSGQNYNLGFIIVIFRTTAVPNTSTGSSCTGSTCGVVGGGTTLDSTTTFTLTANTTYYYTGTTGKGGLIIQNITSKVQSYTNGGGGKATDTIMISVYTMPTLTNVQNYSLGANPFVRIFNVNRTIQTGQTNIWEHGGTLDIAIQQNTSYAVTLISKFSGLKVYHTSFASVPMSNTIEGKFVGATWSPPFKITINNLNSFNLFLNWQGIQNPVLIFQTVTSITNTSCLAGSTCTTTTVITWQTTTSTINNLQGGSGSQAIIGNLIYYWPIWLLPMFFIPFGMQGILIGFIFGDVIGGISGIIPLWAAFLLGLGTLYLLQKSRF